LRDCLLERHVMDFDFAVSCGAIKCAQEFCKKIKGAFVLLDEEHGCARIVKKTKEGILTFDFADFRGKTISDDLALRDFTINTLCVDVQKIAGNTILLQAILSHDNALEDIRSRKISMVSVRSFKDDPLRLVRAFSLQATLDFSIDRKTLAQIKKDKDLLAQTAYERIRDEFFKILLSERAAPTLILMDKVGLLEKIIPQIAVMFNVKQGGYHHLDVWKHSLEVVTQLEKVFSEVKHDQDIKNYLEEPLAGVRNRLALMKLAALLHDIGKPDTRRKEKKRMTFHGHERVGRDISRPIALMLKLSTDERHILEDMVFWHLRPGYLSNFNIPSERAMFRYFRDTKKEALSIALLSLADQRSTRGPLTTASKQKHHEKIAWKIIKRYLAKSKENPLKRLITGHDLIRQLKLTPSPVFAKILRAVEERQTLGEINTKTQALVAAKAMVKKNKGRNIN